MRRYRLYVCLVVVMLLMGFLRSSPAAASHVPFSTATVAGSFQSEIGCPGDWQPSCDLSLMSDPDGDGVYTFTIPAGTLPVGAYEYKVALNRSWDYSFPANNQRFEVAAADNIVTFYYNSATHEVRHVVEGTRPPRTGDDDVFWDGLRHDSRDTLYRVPLGAVPEGAEFLVRFRTFHDDVSSVTVRVWHTGLNAERLYDMQRVAQDVSCYQDLPFNCDFWQARIEAGPIGTIYYRFIVRDGSKVVYYEDDSEVRDGGLGRPFDQSPDWGWAVTVHRRDFLPITWMKNAVVYQIFPDRFRNGDPSNDPKPVRGNPRLSSDPRYAYPNGDPTGASRPEWDQILRMRWGELPEGYCRNYAGDYPCPPRFAQPASTREQPRGRDYYGGDLEGVTEKLSYLKRLGVTAIYFNPIFAAGSNHRYDTRDYKIIDPYLGNLGDWRTLVRAAHRQGIRIILDGVFNHMSSDSPVFDRYHNWSDALYGVGACESVSSPYRSWFRFRRPVGSEPAACAPYTRDGDSYYAAWAGFDSLPQLAESDPVKAHIYGADSSVARYWLRQGADGWRLDVMPDKSVAFWREFRQRVKQVDPNAVIIGELWKKFDVLPFVQGDTADTTMNYRFRDAVISLLAPGPFDGKGFPGSGQPIRPSEFVNRLQSIREDYPDATYWTLMNLLDSHDTERVLWTLTPGVENPDGRERNSAHLAEGKTRLRLAALIQMTMPGAPTIYYGDEVGLTGDDDPDDRRTFPWGDREARAEGDERQPDMAMYRYYRDLIHERHKHPSLVNGDLRFLLVDDDAGVVAYGRKWRDEASIVVLNTSKQARQVTVPVVGYLPENTELSWLVGGHGEAYVRNGGVILSLGPLAGALLVTRDADLTPTAAPSGLQASADGMQVHLSWQPVAGAAGYNVYRSPVTGGGYVRVNAAPVTTTGYLDDSAELRSGQKYYYVVRALDGVGNESANSNEANATPGYRIGWANLQWPHSLDYTVSARYTTDTVYGQVWIDGVTNQPGPTPGLIAQLGYGPQGSDPRSWDTWVPMQFNTDVGNNDEYKGVLQPDTPGTYDYLVRYSTTGGESWTYGDIDGTESGSFQDQVDSPGTLVVHPNPDQTPPEAPTNLRAYNNGPSSILLDWDASTSLDVYRYDVYRSTQPGGPYDRVGSTDAAITQYADSGLQTGTRYYYVVRAVDEAANVSAPSNEASAVPSSRQVAVTFEVAVPATTPPDATVYIVGNQPQICNWCNPHTVALTKGADGKWRITLEFTEGTSVEYKYTLGSWDYVEKGPSCEEISNRTLRVVGDSEGRQLVQDTVANWRNISPCGN